MNLVGKLAEFVGGSIFKEAKDLVTEYFPPEMSQEKRLEFDLKFAELAQKKASEAGALANSQLQLELADTQSARQVHQMSRMPAVVTVMLTLMVSGLLYALIFVAIPGDGRELTFSLFASVFTLWGASITYWVGTTRGSQEKNAIISGGR